MLSRDDADLIRAVVEETVRKLRADGLLKDERDIAYREITATLKQYYTDGEVDPAVTDAIGKLEADPYVKILPLHFRYGYTIEGVAGVMGVDTSTIVRNKKRVSLRIYEILGGLET